ncbi:selenoprotein M-like [Mytilus edulis]|uniref:selenoprotein M-like n=1 Tax=Mytilus edulis TaxID=6550 RepID=UPI0039EF63E8
MDWFHKEGLYYIPQLNVTEANKIPELILYNKDDVEIFRIPLDKTTYDKLDNLIKDLGFYRQKTFSDNLPAEYENGPVPPPGGVSIDDLLAGFSLCERYGIQSELTAEYSCGK